VVTGAATKGPIRGANVAVYALNEFGFSQVIALATTITDATGNFTVSLPAGTGLVRVGTRGGAFIDELDQQPDPALKRQLSLTVTQGSHQCKSSNERKGSAKKSASNNNPKLSAESYRLLTWAERLKRVFKMDVSVCSLCGGEVKIIA